MDFLPLPPPPPPSPLLLNRMEEDPEPAPPPPHRQRTASSKEEETMEKTVCEVHETLAFATSPSQSSTISPSIQPISPPRDFFSSSNNHPQDTPTPQEKEKAEKESPVAPISHSPNSGIETSLQTLDILKQIPGNQSLSDPPPPTTSNPIQESGNPTRLFFRDLCGFVVVNFYWVAILCDVVAVACFGSIFLEKTHIGNHEAFSIGARAFDLGIDFGIFALFWNFVSLLLTPFQNEAERAKLGKCFLVGLVGISARYTATRVLEIFEFQTRQFHGTSISNILQFGTTQEKVSLETLFDPKQTLVILSLLFTNMFMTNRGIIVCS